MLSADSIREQVQRFVNGALPLDEFEDWLASGSWNIHQHGSKAVQRLVFAIELRLAEHSSGHLDDDRLREELKALVKNAPVESLSTASSSSEITLKQTFVACFSLVSRGTGVSVASAPNQTERRKLKVAS